MEDLEARVTLAKFQPRSFQIPLINALERDNKKRLLAVWPRRAGKDICAFNIIVRQAVKKVGLYLYLLPTATQARKIIWDGIMIDGTAILDFIPPQLVENKNVQEMKIKLKNGSIIQLSGSDNYDRLMGINAQA